jgi:hypothetical protein
MQARFVRIAELLEAFGPQQVGMLAYLQPDELSLARKINPTCFTLSEFMFRRSEPDSFVNKVLAQPVIRLLEGDHHGA